MTIIRTNTTASRTVSTRRAALSACVGRDIRSTETAAWILTSVWSSSRVSVPPRGPARTRREASAVSVPGDTSWTRLELSASTTTSAMTTRGVRMVVRTVSGLTSVAVLRYLSNNYILSTQSSLIAALNWQNIKVSGLKHANCQKRKIS